MSSSAYWITVAIEADSLDEAKADAKAIAGWAFGRVVQVDHEPPQGSTIVGPMYEDDLEMTT